MRTVSFLYKDKVSLKALIEEQALDCTVPYLIRIYTAIASRKEAAQLARTLQAQFPQAQIIGCSASGSDCQPCASPRSDASSRTGF